MILALVISNRRGLGEESPSIARFEDHVQPILMNYCYGCHGLGMKKAGIAFDGFDSDAAMLKSRDLWWSVLKNVRAGIMPPAGKAHPDSREIQVLANWIKRDVFGLDPEQSDPGRVTVRRLNRVEYRNTIKDLMGIDFKAEEEFPPDDTGYGFDNIGDVLTVSPLLLEKYFQAAEIIVKAAVPTVSRAIPERIYRGVEFRGEERGVSGDRMSFTKASRVSRTFSAEPSGDYRLTLEVAIQRGPRNDLGRCTVSFRIGDRELMRESYTAQQNKTLHYTFDQRLSGDQRLSFELIAEKSEAAKLSEAESKAIAKTDSASKSKPVEAAFRIISLRVQGPLDPRHWSRPPGYSRFFPKDEPPAVESERRQYAREVLERFARKAHRRPVDNRTIDRLIAIAEKVYRVPGKRFEEGIAQAMVAVLASPRFVFRIEAPLPGPSTRSPALLDEYALASRLSYFLWSTMPDEELFDLAARGRLRSELPKQVGRMLKDPRAHALTQNFVGQWLQVRDLDGLYFNERAILRREGVRLRGADTERNVLVRDVRRAMKSETELAFESVAQQDGCVLDWIDCDYTFLNERLAKYYGIPGVQGSDMRRVTLPKDSPRGGVLTHGTILAVTSNPSRTSPVKRGQFILDNILGTPAPPPPPDIPALEALKKEFKDHDPTTRELMALHRSKPMCNACHSRMDPLGLALDNFNPLGLWREAEAGQKIDASGKLITGESFKDIRDLKKTLKEKHRLDFYRCLTEKLLTYALGRGLDYYDVDTVDQVVERLDREGGRFSALLMGIIESAPFQKRRNNPAMSSGSTASAD